MKTKQKKNHKVIDTKLISHHRIVLATFQHRDGKYWVPIDNLQVGFTPALAAGFFELCLARKRWGSGLTDFEFYRKRRDDPNEELITKLVNRLRQAIDEIHGEDHGEMLIKNCERAKLYEMAGGFPHYFLSVEAENVVIYKSFEQYRGVFPADLIEGLLRFADDHED